MRLVQNRGDLVEPARLLFAGGDGAAGDAGAQRRERVLQIGGLQRLEGDAVDRARLRRRDPDELSRFKFELVRRNRARLEALDQLRPDLASDRRR